MKKLTILAIAFLMSLAIAEDQRTWTSVDGRRTKGTMLSANAISVTVQLQNGRTFTIPLDKLSQADRDYVRSGNKAVAAAAPVAQPAGERPLTTAQRARAKAAEKKETKKRQSGCLIIGPCY